LARDRIRRRRAQERRGRAATRINSFDCVPSSSRQHLAGPTRGAQIGKAPEANQRQGDHHCRTIIGGMVTSTIHVLIVTPEIFYIMKARALRAGRLQMSNMEL
jgi:hypothetical protein